ncbi:methyltransferase domain-containing protein [Bradyrhizobium sp. SZCCHNPS2010]|uniref:methyltransferase domain-containing protein n=1 Tax=Bradyrhizobium sp. SZCCHNPS2010 TaxID=3057333 RepID=UPI0029160BE0|nr:methyltransferase domain-containing protein [Bradyrhizobium sp. SZCCHNPS2010]
MTGAENASRSGGGLWHRFGRQLARPKGLTGLLVGRLMAQINRAPYRLALEALAPQRSDRVLEIGFGPGEGIAALTVQVSAGRIIGLDAASAMLAQASRRNRKAIAEGRVALGIGEASDLPWAAASFDRVLAVNVAYFFDSRGDAASEIRRVLAPGGRAVLYVTDRATMAHWPFAGPQTHKTYDAFSLQQLLRAGGFAADRIRIERHRLPFGAWGLVAIASA